VTRHWFGMPHEVIVDERMEYLEDPVPFLADRKLSNSEVQQGLREQRESLSTANTGAVNERNIFRMRYARQYPPGYGPWSFSVYRLWNSEWVLCARLALAPILRSITHSKHLQHALKNAIGVALLSMAGFYPVGSSGTLLNTTVLYKLNEYSAILVG
jgi:hypothetical protein